MYYSLKGFINFKDTQKVLDTINAYQNLRVNAFIVGEAVHFETVLSDEITRDDMANFVRKLIDLNGGYAVFHECVQNPDNTIGRCTMTHKYQSDGTSGTGKK